MHSVGTVEAQYRFLPDRQVCPYVFGSLGGTDVRADHGIDHLKFTGGMAGIGAGTLVGLTRHFVMDVTARLDGVPRTRSRSRAAPRGSSCASSGSSEGRRRPQRARPGARRAPGLRAYGFQSAAAPGQTRFCCALSQQARSPPL